MLEFHFGEQVNVLISSHALTSRPKVLGFEQIYRPMYEILVTGPLCTSECAGECRLSENLCKRALDVTADVIVEATPNADILTINASEDIQ